jgi:hypothetical protein
VTAGSFELRGFSSLAAAYADGAGGFTVAVNGATDGMSSAPIVAHFTPAGGSPEGLQVVLPDEKSAVFERVPKTAARPGRDKAALFLVSGAPSDMTATGTRLRAYAWNGIGTYVNQALANETKAPRTFNDSLLVFGCGGAVLYAIDGIDGTHALELVLVKQSGS